jgi:Xaa-Pro aminopeptidase
MICGQIKVETEVTNVVNSVKGSDRNIDRAIMDIMKTDMLNAIIVTDSYNMRYISGYRGEGMLLILSDRKYVITDSRYTEQAEIECPEYSCVDIAKNGYFKTVAKLICVEKSAHSPQTIREVEKFQSDLDMDCSNTGRKPGLRIGFENKSISYNDYSSLEKTLEGCEFVELDNKLDKLRQIKCEEEIEKIRTAESIGDEAFTHILSFIRPGVTEREVALELEYFMKKNGAERLSFDTIAASGTNSSMPHAIPTDRVIENGDFLTMDFGCVYEGYCSDMTRTVAVGDISDNMEYVYEVVLKAQLEALRSIKPGAKCSDVDKIARDIIADAGYGNCFGHGLGHSVGLYIHEEPRLSPKCDDILQPGMLMTVEPGIYIPGRFGVRIEDLVVVTREGYINLTGSTKKLIKL